MRRHARWLALTVAAVLCAAGGWTYATARGDADAAYAHSREEALSAARAHIATLNSRDGDDVDASVRRWRDAVHGPLKDELLRTGDDSAKVLAAEGSTLRATVTDAALTELDTRAGSAEAIATVRVEVQPRGGDPTTDRKRFEATLDRTDAGWKLSSLTAVPVGAP
jgi:Mce-associated membrane protein